MLGGWGTQDAGVGAVIVLERKAEVGNSTQMESV